MSNILGLDVSTSCVGLCILEVRAYVSGNLGTVPVNNIITLDRIEFKECKTLWEKADKVETVLGAIRSHIDRVVIEEPLMGFRTGMSSAQTITQLMRFNGIVSYIARNVFQKEPEYIGSAHARKLCGIKLQRTAIGGPQKEQVFAHMAQHDLNHVVWPCKKNGKIVDWSRDACDAYVIARSAAINGPIVPVSKKKKTSKNK